MSQAEQRQKGGVVSYIIIGVVLLGLLVGGVYFSKQQGRTASRSGTAPVVQKPADKDTKQNTSDKQPTTENKPKEEKAAPSSNSNNQSPQPKSTPQTQQPTSGSQTTPPAVANTGPSHIASTGPEDFLVVVIALSALTAGISFYRQSSSRLQRAALDSSL